MSKSDALVTTVLGKDTVYSNEYNPGVLQPIERKLGRAAVKVQAPNGFDLWRLYELTYLNKAGIPCAAIGCISVPADSPCIVESKSLKLYIGSFTQTKFADLNEVAAVITHDLNAILGTEVTVQLWDLEKAQEAAPFAVREFPGELIDITGGVVLSDFTYNPELLQRHEGSRVEETVRTNLLRTLCPVTGQPDHASVMIRYQGEQINHQELFAYLMSLRMHRGFHEQCVEMIYSDIKTRLKPDRLEVAAAFTRRGGIDINPVRSDFEVTQDIVVRTLRQ